MTNGGYPDYDVVVVGAGCAGLSAGAGCAEHGLSVVCVEAQNLPGGLVANVGIVDGFPSNEPLSGASLADQMSRIAKGVGVEMRDAEVARVEPNGNGWQTVLTDGSSLVSRSVIVASGATLRKLEVPGAESLEGRGVSYCDWCDGGFFKDQPVAVIGGGDSALQAGLHLANICSEVHLVLRDGLRARRSYVGAASDQERIVFHWEVQVERIEGVDGVESLLLRSVTDGTTESLLVRGVFAFIGISPRTGFLPEGLERDGRGAIVTGINFATSLPRLYAVGAVRSGYKGTLVGACGEGVSVAAHVAESLGA